MDVKLPAGIERYSAHLELSLAVSSRFHRSSVIRPGWFKTRKSDRFSRPPHALSECNRRLERRRIHVGFGFHDRLHHQLPTPIQHGDHRRLLVHVHADILDVATHLSCLLEGKIIALKRNLSLKVKCHASVALPTGFSSALPPLPFHAARS